MRTLALVLPQGYDYCRAIIDGVADAAEETGGWQILQLPVHPSGKIPVRTGMESLDGVIAWTDRKHAWMEDLPRWGVPAVNCGGDWNGEPGIGTVVVRLRSALQLAVRHFQDLSLRKIYFFGHRITSDPQRAQAMRALTEVASSAGMEVEAIETRRKNPDENLERLLTPEKESRLLREFSVMTGTAGLFAENDYFARLACNLASLAGKQVPGDLAILSGSGDLLGRLGEPTLTTVPLPGREIGREAFRLIERASRGIPLPTNPVIVDANRIVVRESTAGKSGEVIMERVHRRIEQEAVHGLTVAELSEVAGMSQKSLRQRYRQVFGEEPSQHIRRLRLAKAKNMLTDTMEPIVEIAAACGFASQPAFCNYFLRHEGTTPSHFRKQSGQADHRNGPPPPEPHIPCRSPA